MQAAKSLAQSEAPQDSNSSDEEDDEEADDSGVESVSDACQGRNQDLADIFKKRQLTLKHFIANEFFFFCYKKYVQIIKFIELNPTHEGLVQ